MKLTSRISFYIVFSPYLCDNSIITDTEMKKILLLGSGELGKEFVISAQRKKKKYGKLTSFTVSS